jgi:hypothetical protein
VSLRDALARKRQRETFYDVLVDDPTEAEEQLERAQADLRLATLRHGEESAEAQAARVSVEEARAALTGCTHRITFRNLPAHEFEALVNAHPPGKDAQAKGDQWDIGTFGPALVAACAVDADMTEKEWIDELSSDRWSVADRNGIFSAALAANVSPRSVTIPKG